MTDQITDQDRRAARAWAKNWQGDLDADTSAAARVILATVDAPAPALSEELRELQRTRLDGQLSYEDLVDFCQDIERFITRIEQTEREITEARAEVDQMEAAREIHERMYREARSEVERLTAERDEAHSDLAEVTSIRDSLREEYDHARDEVGRLTAERLDRNPETKARVKAALNNLDRVETVTVQKGAESNAESIDPADVKPGEAWKAHIWFDGVRQPGTAIKSSGGDWTVTRDDGSRTTYRMNEYVELVSRLVPAPRVITNHEELDQVKRRTVIRDAAGVVCERDAMGDYWTTFTSLANQKPHIEFPATVLWEPEA